MMTLPDAIAILRVACEDAREREAILDALWPVLLGDDALLTSAVTAAWPTSADSIREVVAEVVARWRVR